MQVVDLGSAHGPVATCESTMHPLDRDDGHLLWTDGRHAVLSISCCSPCCDDTTDDTANDMVQ